MLGDCHQDAAYVPHRRCRHPRIQRQSTVLTDTPKRESSRCSSVLIASADREKGLKRELQRAGCHICSTEEVEAIRAYLFHERGFNVEAVGRDATWIAEQAGFKVAAKTRVLVTPIEFILMLL